MIDNDMKNNQRIFDDLSMIFKGIYATSNIGKIANITPQLWDPIDRQWIKLKLVSTSNMIEKAIKNNQLTFDDVRMLLKVFMPLRISAKSLVVSRNFETLLIDNELN